MKYLLILLFLFPCVVLGGQTAWVASSPCSTVSEGTWIKGDSVCVNGSGDAIATANADTLWIYNFDLAVPVDSVVDSIRVRIDAHSMVVDKDNACRFRLYLSKNNGSTWCDTFVTTASMTTTETGYFPTHLDWGCTWTPAACDSIAVQIWTSSYTSGGSNAGHIDYIAASAYYSPPAPSEVSSQKGLNVDDKLGAGKGLCD